MYIAAIYSITRVPDIESLDQCSGFDWDAANTEKIWKRHRIAAGECEQVFRNVPLVVADDVKHSGPERRYYALGRTDTGKIMFIVFTLREPLIRVISARRANKRERKEYETR